MRRDADAGSSAGDMGDCVGMVSGPKSVGNAKLSMALLSCAFIDSFSATELPSIDAETSSPSIDLGKTNNASCSSSSATLRNLYQDSGAWCMLKLSLVLT